MAALCFEENEQINITEYTQIAMLTVETAILKVLEEMGHRPDVAAGLSHWRVRGPGSSGM